MSLRQSSMLNFPCVDFTYVENKINLVYLYLTPRSQVWAGDTLFALPVIFFGYFLPSLVSIEPSCVNVDCLTLKHNYKNLV